jgi:hypothetical protein
MIGALSVGSPAILRASQYISLRAALSIPTGGRARGRIPKREGANKEKTRHALYTARHRQQGASVFRQAPTLCGVSVRSEQPLRTNSTGQGMSLQLTPCPLFMSPPDHKSAASPRDCYHLRRLSLVHKNHHWSIMVYASITGTIYSGGVS